MSDIGLRTAPPHVKAVPLRQDLVALKSIVGARLSADSERLLCLADLRGDRSILEKGRRSQEVHGCGFSNRRARVSSPTSRVLRAWVGQRRPWPGEALRLLHRRDLQGHARG